MNSSSLIKKTVTYAIRNRKLRLSEFKQVMSSLEGTDAVISDDDMEMIKTLQRKVQEGEIKIEG